MRLGVFGGTFDPPHLGHMIVAQDAAFQLRLDRVLFVPAAIPPHKVGQPTSTASVRGQLVRAAIEGDPRFDLDARELRRAGPSYTVETLRELRHGHPDDQLFLLIGADQFRELPTWRAPEEIGQLATIVVLSRPGEPEQSADFPPMESRGSSVQLDVTYLQVTAVNISSTEIRRRVAAGEPVRYLLPEAVERIVRREGLYLGAAATSAGSTRPARGYHVG